SKRKCFLRYTRDTLSTKATYKNSNNKNVLSTRYSKKVRNMFKSHHLLNIKENELEKLLKLNKIKNSGRNLNVPGDLVLEKQFSKTGNFAVVDLPKHVSYVDLLS
ncbi:8259_t:CDS:2, partial [Diversispora eburnea]